MASFTRSLVAAPGQSFVRIIASVGLTALLGYSACAYDYEAIRLQYPVAIYDEPDVGVDVHPDPVFPDGIVELWITALKRPDAELQRMVVDSMVDAHSRGLVEVTESRETMLQMLNQPDLDVSVVRSIAAALVAFRSKQDAKQLAQLSQANGFALSQIIEPALAEWKSDAMREDWTARVSKSTASDSSIVLALEGLRQLSYSNEQRSVLTTLLKSMTTNQDASLLVRTEAAQTMTALQSDDQVEIASELIDGSPTPSLPESLVAISLLRGQKSQRARDLIGALTEHENTAVQSSALEVLYVIDREAIARKSDRFATSKDVNVRRWLAKSLASRCTVPRVRQLAKMLNDVNPKLRVAVAGVLVRLGRQNKGLRPAVLENVTAILAQDDWRSCEQGCRVLAQLDHKPAAQRMVQLLNHDRPEVIVAAAWGLSQLKVQSSLDDLLNHATKVHQQFQRGNLNADTPGSQLHQAHLFYTFGSLNFAPAEKLLRSYVGKKLELGEDARAAAIWALGKLHVNEPEEKLVSDLVARMTDSSIEIPEYYWVQQMSAVSLGRMKATGSLTALQQRASDEGHIASRTAWWAITQITGQDPPEFRRDKPKLMNDWFLTPIVSQ